VHENLTANFGKVRTADKAKGVEEQNFRRKEGGSTRFPFGVIDKIDPKKDREKKGKKDLGEHSQKERKKVV